MFGYIVINKEELKLKDYTLYRSYYCGLCKSLQQHYGRFGQLTLTFDMTFLSLLLTSLYEPTTAQVPQRCMLHPLKKQLTSQNYFFDYAGDMNLLLAYHNLMDDWTDEKKVNHYALAKILKKSYNQLEEKYPRQIAAVKLYMVQLKKCEEENFNNLDAAAGYTGTLLGEIFVHQDDEWAPILRKIGFYLGKFVYLMDAFEDLEKDEKAQRYNPLIQLKDHPHFSENCFQMLTMMAASCAKEFEKLPIVENIDILRNILYSGIWTKYEQIKKKQMEGTNSDAKPL